MVYIKITVVTRKVGCATGEDGGGGDVSGIGSNRTGGTVTGGAHDSRGGNQTRAILILIHVHYHVVTVRNEE